MDDVQSSKLLRSVINEEMHVNVRNEEQQEKCQLVCDLEDYEYRENKMRKVHNKFNIQCEIL